LTLPVNQLFLIWISTKPAQPEAAGRFSRVMRAECGFKERGIAVLKQL